MFQPDITPKIIVIDDDGAWVNLLKEYAESLGYNVDCVDTFKEAKAMIKAADQAGENYSIATIDRNFKIGEEGFKAELGIEMLKFIKKDYQYIACIMVSGQNVTPDEVLDLRDDHRLDYYIRKDLISYDILKKAIERALRRTQPKTLEDRKRSLQDVLKKWMGVRDEYKKNLSHYELIAAKKGLDVDVTTMNAIHQCELGIVEAEKYIESIVKEMESLEKN